jgi:hypothetical protein
MGAKKSGKKLMILTKQVLEQAEGDQDKAAGEEKITRNCLHKQLRKTKFCLYHLNGACQFGDNCAFAHSTMELQGAPDLRKTRLCKSYTEGGCNDPNCTFAHSEEELRSTDMFYKKTLCMWFEKGRCRNGEQCRFAHGMDEWHQRHSAGREAAPRGDVAAKEEAAPPAPTAFPMKGKGKSRHTDPVAWAPDSYGPAHPFMKRGRPGRGDDARTGAGGFQQSHSAGAGKGEHHFGRGAQYGSLGANQYDFEDSALGQALDSYEQPMFVQPPAGARGQHRAPLRGQDKLYVDCPERMDARLELLLQHSRNGRAGLQDNMGDFNSDEPTQWSPERLRETLASVQGMAQSAVLDAVRDAARDRFVQRSDLEKLTHNIAALAEQLSRFEEQISQHQQLQPQPSKSLSGPMPPPTRLAARGARNKILMQ